ncbi:MAG: TPM domain-containing protein [Thiomonas sp.]
MRLLRTPWRCWLLAAALLCGLTAGAQTTLAPIPALTAPVTDLTGTLSAQQVAALDQELRDFAARKGSQIAVLIVPTTAPETIEQYSIRVVDAWKLGRKGVDDGVLLLVAKNDRKLRIEVGYGLEGVIPDAIAKRIISETIAPRFKEGDYFGGIQAGVESIARLIDGEALPPPKAPNPSADPNASLVTAIFLLVAAIAIGSALRAALGRVVGSGLAGLVAGVVGWWLVGSLLLGIGMGLAAFIAVFSGIRLGGGAGGLGGGFGGGGFDTDSDGYSGDGGSFGGGGASGEW